MTNPLDAEPVAVTTAIRMVLLAAMAFGLDWTASQVTAVMLAVEAVLGLVTRSQVTSKKTLDEEAGGRASASGRGG